MVGPLFPEKTTDVLTAATTITEVPFFEDLTTSATASSSATFATTTSFESSTITSNGSFNVSIQKEGLTTPATNFKDIFSILNFKDIFTDDGLKEPTESSTTTTNRSTKSVKAESSLDSDGSTTFKQTTPKVERKPKIAIQNPKRFPIQDIISDKAVKYFNEGNTSTTESQTSTSTTTTTTASISTSTSSSSIADDPELEESFSNVVRKLSSDVDGIKHQMEYGG